MLLDEDDDDGETLQAPYLQSKPVLGKAGARRLGPTM